MIEGFGVATLSKMGWLYRLRQRSGDFRACHERLEGLPTVFGSFWPVNSSLSRLICELLSLAVRVPVPPIDLSGEAFVVSSARRRRPGSRLFLVLLSRVGPPLGPKVNFLGLDNQATLVADQH